MATRPDERSESASTDRREREPGSTHTVRSEEQAREKDAPRLPHERDESSDSQQNQDGSAPAVGRQAHEDVERGLVDTSRGEETDRVYNDQVRR